MKTKAKHINRVVANEIEKIYYKANKNFINSKAMKKVKQKS